MYDQNVTREQQGGIPAHLSVVSDAPQTDSEAGAARSDRENSIEDNGFTDAPVVTEAPAVDAGAAYVVGEANVVAELDVETVESEEFELDDERADNELPGDVRPADKPLLGLIPGFDQMFEEIEDQWQERALCAQTDPEAFFPEKGGSTREAKRICLGCEVKDECLEYALANDERFGIWGGLSERERRRLKRGIV